MEHGGIARHDRGWAGQGRAEQNRVEQSKSRAKQGIAVWCEYTDNKYYGAKF